MKWKTSDGDEIECTVEEYKELKGTTTQPSKVERFVKARHHWTREELKFMKANANLPVRKVAKVIGLSVSQVGKKYYDLGGKRKFAKKLISKSKKEKNPLRYNTQKQIATLGVKYMKDGLSRSEAWKKAIKEYRGVKENGNVKNK